MYHKVAGQLCWCFIKWCEKHDLLNQCCGLSTIEYLRGGTPERALEYINGVMARRGSPVWKMPKPGDKKLQLEEQRA